MFDGRRQSRLPPTTLRLGDVTRQLSHTPALHKQKIHATRQTPTSITKYQSFLKKQQRTACGRRPAVRLLKVNSEGLRNTKPKRDGFCSLPKIRDARLRPCQGKRNVWREASHHTHRPDEKERRGNATSQTPPPTRHSKHQKPEKQKTARQRQRQQHKRLIIFSRPGIKLLSRQKHGGWRHEILD